MVKPKMSDSTIVSHSVDRFIYMITSSVGFFQVEFMRRRLVSELIMFSFTVERLLVAYAL